MTPIEEVLNYILTIQVWSVVKLAVLITLGLYLIFGLMIIREVDLMNKTIIGVFNLPIKIIAWLHFLFALFIFILAIIIL